MKKTIIFGLLIVGILVVSGCVQRSTKYVCPDGSTVSYASLCPKEQARETYRVAMHKDTFISKLHPPADDKRCETVFFSRYPGGYAYLKCRIISYEYFIDKEIVPPEEMIKSMECECEAEKLN